jgi:D-sedoheptulose 7-phosphate isomerase
MTTTALKPITTEFTLDIEAYFQESGRVLVETGEACQQAIREAAASIVHAVQGGGKLLLCGNGGSAADAQHWAAELTSRLSKDFERPAIPALALTTDTSFLTAYANDYDFSGVFARQIEALGNEGDALVLISTSGNSDNLCRAAEAARRRGITTLGLLGGNGGRLASLVDASILVPSSKSQHIQESHSAIIHVICSLVERALYAASL